MPRRPMIAALWTAVLSTAVAVPVATWAAPPGGAKQTPRKAAAAPTAKEPAAAAKEPAAADDHSEHPKVEKAEFGKMPDGKPVEIYTLSDHRGVRVSVITYGAILTRVQTRDRTGHVGDILLGYDSLEKYLTANGPHFGSLIGRVSNRIAKGEFKVDGKTYHTAINNGPNSLHGGKVGYDKRLWTAEEVPGKAAVKMTLTDPDGTEGYPGTVHATVEYALSDRDGLVITYDATTDKATPISLTSHGYWNLKDGGKSDVRDETLRLHAGHYLPVDKVQIPTGEVAPVAGTPFDFRKFKPLGEDLDKTPEADKHKGFDHTMVIDGTPGTVRPAALLYDPSTGRTLRMLTTEPGVQFYTGNFLDGTITGRDGVVYKQNNAFALEAQAFPDAVNHPSFPDTILRPGKAYHQETEYQFDAGAKQP